jgi:hypothetical protein
VLRLASQAWLVGLKSARETSHISMLRRATGIVSRDHAESVKSAPEGAQACAAVLNGFSAES